MGMFNFLYSKLTTALILIAAIAFFTFSGCKNSIENKPENNFTDSINAFYQIDSIANINPGLALSLLELENQGNSNTTTYKTAYYHYFKGRILLQQNDGLTQSLSNLENALELAEKLNLNELKVKVYQEISIVYSKQRKLKKAMETLDRAFDLAEKIDYKDISLLYIEAGWVIYELDHHNIKAKEYLFSAMEKHNNKMDSVFFAKVYHNLSTIYLGDNELDSAIYCIKKAIPVFENKEMNILLCNAYNTFGAIYEKKNDANNALKYYKLSAETGDIIGSETAYIYTNIGRFYQYELLDNFNALKYYIKSLEKPGSPKNLYSTFESIANIYEKMGQSAEALEYYKKSMQLQKSDLENNYKESLKRLEVEFDVKRNKQRIKELNLDIKNQFMKMRQQRIIIISLIVFTMLAVLILLLIYRQKNLKQQYEKVLLEQQLLRSQMNPHFIFNAISVIQFLIKNNSNIQADKYLSKFSRLLRKSLENSTGQFAPVQDEVQVLEDYLALQKLRFPDEFEYLIETYDGFEEETDYIPPMIIQPFVENCIEHGIRDIGRKGEIKLNLTRNEKTLICVVQDNGRGINSESKAIKTGKRSLSTIISKKRLEILKKKLKIESKIVIKNRIETEGVNGTTIILTLPIINSNTNV
jgi:tetratricopeptide (TPR) repeat protein